MSIISEYFGVQRSRRLKIDPMLNNPFIWDGSSLGTITEKNILNKYIIKYLEYWDILINGFHTICIIRKYKDYTPCIVDELKPLFGLIKLGTHYIKYDNNYIILIRSRVNKECKEVIGELFLHEYVENSGLFDEKIVQKIKEIYVFRDFLCMNNSNDDSIILRKNITDDDILPISIIDTSLKIDKLVDPTTPSVLSESVFNKWLTNDSPSEILTKMCRIKNENTIVLTLFHLKSKINVILNRISNNEYIDLSDIIINRICNKLEFHASKRIKKIK
jgi:hypothetical protein